MIANIGVWTVIPKREAVKGRWRNSLKGGFSLFLFTGYYPGWQNHGVIGMDCSTHGRVGKYTTNVVRYEENIYIQFRRTPVFKGNMYSVIAWNGITRTCLPSGSSHIAYQKHTLRLDPALGIEGVWGTCDSTAVVMLVCTIRTSAKESCCTDISS